MTTLVQTSNNQQVKLETALARDVFNGLQQTPRRLPSKYFYDQRGDQLFQQIMAMPEYYLTNCEMEIFTQQKQDILDAIGLDSFELVELGAGDGQKTKVLLEHFLERGVDFEYRPIDISPDVLDTLQTDLAVRWPQLNVDPLPGDYFKMLNELNRTSDKPKVVLFLGANIGNYDLAQATNFLGSIKANLHPGDLLLVGIDLKKDPAVVLNAYNDPAGITANFNLNLLRRLNRELGANFQLDQWRHWETYDPISGDAKSHLVSCQQQTVVFPTMNYEITFQAWEPIWTELSKKYNFQDINDLAKNTGFRVKRNFHDARAYFVDSLWQAK